MLSGLQSILDKQVVLSTANSQDLLDRPDKIESDYLKHVETFIPMGDTNEFVNRLEKQVAAHKTPKGMIVAPYGYGKTSTLGFIWRQCELRDLVAVPPFYCAGFADILTATYGWTKFRLSQREPELVAELDKLYVQYMDQTVDTMAGRYAEEQGIAKINALGMLKSMRKEGKLVLELEPPSLLRFLDGATELVARAGFGGLVILADEFQQFLSKDAQLRTTLQKLREFIWGLPTRQAPFGVILSMPTFTEAKLAEQANDILARLKDGGLNYRLKDIYTVDFPANLWSHYRETFKLGSVATQVIDTETLRSIGQIAEREDLGEGPRTVIDSLKRAILCFTDHNRSYTPIDLIDDFLESNITFLSHTNKLKTSTRQALDSAVVDSLEKRDAVKLMAAFPRGCPVEVQRKYDLYDAINKLSKQGHGELMTHLMEGYTLLELSRAGGPTHTVDIIVTKFWHSYEVDEFRQEAAVRAFTTHVLPRFFEQRRGPATVGWSKLDFQPSPKGPLIAAIEGTFNAKYPRRQLRLQVGMAHQDFHPPNHADDISLDFALFVGDEDDLGSIEMASDKHLRLNLNYGQHLSPPLPDDLSKLQQLVNPEFITPLLMLSLVDYFDSWETREERSIPESDRQEIEGFFIPRLINHSVHLLFNQEMGSTTSLPLRRVGRHMIEQLFNVICQRLYPSYYTFYVQGQYEKVLNDYTNAMRGMSLKERRGHAELQGTKQSLSSRFGLTAVSTFDNRLQSEYAHLIERVEWSGRGDDSTAVLRLKLHPLEEHILQQLRQSEQQYETSGQSFNALSSKRLEKLGRELGYRDEELLFALKLLASRGYVRVNQQEKVIHLHQIGPDADELAGAITLLISNLQSSGELLETKVRTELLASAKELEQKLAVANGDEEELSDVETALHDLQNELNTQVEAAGRHAREKLNVLKQDISQLLRLFQGPTALDREIQSQVAFVMHLNELRQNLKRHQKQHISELVSLQNDIDKALQEHGQDSIAVAVSVNKAAAQYRQQFNVSNQQIEVFNVQLTHLEHWIKLLKDTDLLYSSLEHLPELRNQLTQEVVPEIQAYLSKQGIKALPDWEQFSLKIEAVEQELEKRRRHGNEAFGQEKEIYEEFLRAIGVGEYRPMSRYTYGEDRDSYHDLYEEVRRKTNARLDELARNLEREQSDLWQAQYVSPISDSDSRIVQKVAGDLEGNQTKLQELRGTLTYDLVRTKGANLDQFAQEVITVALSTEAIREALSPVLFAEHDLSDKEQATYRALGTQSEIDLTDLFVQLHRQNVDLELGELLATIESLYRKRRLIVRLRPRG